MKANELMIDDWVYNKNIDKPMQVYPMMFSQMFRRTPDATTEDYNIFPIPLTPEILEKNGIKRDTNGKVFGEYFDEDKNGFLEISVDREGIWWSINYEEYHILRFKYVHELQHALKLCGIEKEIEL